MANKNMATNQKGMFGESSGAKFSDCGKHRLALWRIWDISSPLVMFIGLNPSSNSTATKNSPTIRSASAIASKNGFGGLYMMNLFTFITPNPELIQTAPYSGDLQEEYDIEKVAAKCEKIIFAWGNFKIAEEKEAEVKRKFPEALCLGKNANGTPRHPLFVSANVRSINYFKN